jgi:Mce-associated membrane protein
VNQVSKSGTKNSGPATEPEDREETPEAEPVEPEKAEEPEAEAVAEEAEAEEGEAEEGKEEEGKEEAAEEKSPRPDEKAKPRRPADRRRTVAMVVTVIAALCAAWFGWSWYGAAHDDSLSFSQERDDALRAGEQAVQNLNTLDYRSLGPGLKLWQDSSTSELYQQIVQGRPQFEQAVQKAKTITSAKVLDAAVTELDQHAGKAGVIVALQITVTPPKGEPTIKKTRLVGQLTRTSTGWKLSALAQAPVGASG